MHKRSLFTKRYLVCGKYPTWLQDLADQDPEGKPFLNISTSKRIVPKVLRLTWKGYPLHFDATEKWGYLVPTENVDQAMADVVSGNVETDFPLKEFLACLPSRTSSSPSLRIVNPTEIFVDQVRDFSDMKAFKPAREEEEDVKADGAGLDVGIPGVVFHKLPHKNGPKFRVGNPLGKDFLAAVGEGGALTSHTSHLASKLLTVSSQISYWRNARDRVYQQLKVDMASEELPAAVTQSPEFDRSNTYGAILPDLVVAGTVTRRAVEKTWLTASNAREDRVGSELKSAIRAPPGFHFVGADVDSQELWLASVLGDAARAGHGSTPLGWMSLQGEKSKGTDLHSKAAAAAQVSRDQAKILNYARIYGAGERFAKLLLKQFNPDLSDAEVQARAKRMYQQTKGLSGYSLNEKGAWLHDLLLEDAPAYNGGMISRKTVNDLAKKLTFLDQIVAESRHVKHGNKWVHCHKLTEEAKLVYRQLKGPCINVEDDILLDNTKLKEIYRKLEHNQGKNIKSNINSFNGLVGQTIWFGGSESHTFNRLEQIAMSTFPKTPVLGNKIC